MNRLLDFRKKRVQPKLKLMIPLIDPEELDVNINLMLK